MESAIHSTRAWMGTLCSPHLKAAQATDWRSCWTSSRTSTSPSGGRQVNTLLCLLLWLLLLLLLTQLVEGCCVSQIPPQSELLGGKSLHAAKNKKSSELFILYMFAKQRRQLTPLMSGKVICLELCGDRSWPRK